MATVEDLIENIFMLALVCWREARGEPEQGKTALVFSILNRVRSPKWWGDSVLSVVSKKWQYSSMTDPHDGQLTTWPQSTDPEWRSCLSIARQVWNGELSNPAPGADSYFADYIPPPAWAKPEQFVAKIGHHSFYNTDFDHEQDAIPAPLPEAPHDPFPGRG